jgi:hypothetical protein
MINNDYSGTLHINNLINMNRLYDMMKEALLQESNTNNNNIANNPVVTLPTNTFTHQGHTVLFATINTKNQINPPTINKPNRLFVTKRSQKIFNIIKEPHSNNRIKTVRIIYKNEEEQSNNYNYNNYENEVEEEAKEDANVKKEEYYENAEDEEEYENNYDQINEQNDNYFGSSAYPQYYNIFK